MVVALLCCGDRPQSGDTYGRGETLKAEVMFSEAVTVTGTPQLTLTIGSATRTVDLDYVWDDGEGLVFEYEVQSDDLDTDGISIAADALSLNDATIQDRGGNPADLDLSEHVISNEINDGNHKVDGSVDHPPTVEWTGFDSSPASGDTYGVGEPIAIVVQFNEPVEVSGTPQLELTIGIAVRSMQLEDVWDDDRGLVFRYQVQAEDRDDNGISVAADALKLDGATIQDRGGSDAELDLGEHAISNDGDHKVDGSIDHPPVVDWVHVEEPVNGDTHVFGDRIEVHVGFNEPIDVTGTPELTLNIGAATRVVDLGDVCCDDRMDHLKFYYQVQADDRDADGISIAADALSLNGGTIRDSGGNDAVLELGEHAIINDGDHKVDGSIDNPPVVVALLCCGDRPQSGDTYGRGETLKAEVMFSEAVTVTGTPQLTLTIGSATRTVDLDYVWDDGEGLVFEYEVQSDDLDTDGISIAADALSLNDATIQDRGGNPADLDLSEHVISNEINDGNHKVDGSIDFPPFVTDTYFDSRPPGDTYGIGERVEIHVSFSEPVTVTGHAAVGADHRQRDAHRGP